LLLRQAILNNQYFVFKKTRHVCRVFPLWGLNFRLITLGENLHYFSLRYYRQKAVTKRYDMVDFAA
jgi:hypothetical protein